MDDEGLVGRGYLKYRTIYYNALIFIRGIIFMVAIKTDRPLVWVLCFTSAFLGNSPQNAFRSHKSKRRYRPQK